MELTRQSEIWGYHYDRFAHKKHSYVIQNRILADCIGIGAGSSRSKSRPIVGFNYGKDNGYQLLSYLTELALGFRRLPWCQDRNYRRGVYYDEKYIHEILKQLDPNTIEQLVREVKMIYEHTQAELSKVGLSKVKLVRHIAAKDNNYAQTIMGIRSCAELLGKNDIEFEMDILNSFSCEDGAYGHLSDVQIYHEFDASDVLYCSSLLHSGEKDRIFMESGEWVVINRSANGIVSLPTDSVTYDKTKWSDGLELESNKRKAQEILEERTPFHIRQEREFDMRYASLGKHPKWKRKLAEILLK